MPDFETLKYEEIDGVAWVTLNRPEVHNAFNFQMQRELRELWRGLRSNDAVRCVVLTGAGEKAFCVGIDRSEMMGEWESGGDVGSRPDDAAAATGQTGATPWHFDDPGENIGPKTNDLWKPVVAAVNGMACGGAFYMLGEVDIVIAADHATFFDPHVTFGMTMCFESMHLLQKMPFHEVMRLALLGSHERISAQRAREVGFVTEVVPLEELHDAAEWVATRVASAPPVAIQGTVRSLWTGRELSRMQALDMGRVIIRVGSDPQSLFAGQQAFQSGERVKPRVR
ncbi:MAG: enoyl-CoA hydratase/isomerase family protein [Actinobacteria bacterium]|nr:enoyl-CoA hydratase/isomerase family protein [Actinomycetota bacterium]